MKQNKDTADLVCVGTYYWHRACPRAAWLNASETPLETCSPGCSLFQGLLTADSFLLSGGSHVPIPSSAALTWPRRGHGTCQLMCASILLREEDTVPLESPNTPGLYNLSVSFPTQIPEPCGRDLMKASHLDPSAAKSPLTVHCPAWVSMLMLIYWKKRLF